MENHLKIYKFIRMFSTLNNKLNDNLFLINSFTHKLTNNLHTVFLKLTFNSNVFDHFQKLYTPLLLLLYKLRV